MKYDRILHVGETPVKIVSMSLTLERYAAGRALFNVLSDTPLSGEIRFFAGINNQLASYMTGTITSSVRIDAKQQKITVREKPFALERPMPLALRNVPISDILKAIGDDAKIPIAWFGDWAEIPVPHFINLGTGLDALHLAARLSLESTMSIIFSPNGGVFLAARNMTKQGRSLIRLPGTIFRDVSPIGAECAFLPALRPGMRIQIDEQPETVVVSITVSGDTMRVRWEQGEAS